MPSLPSQLYRERLKSDCLKSDSDQLAVIEKLDALAAELTSLQAKPMVWALPLFKPRSAIRGLYISGTVGRGKSMLMDLFFAAVPVERKRRVHFNEFMLEVHKRLHHARQLQKRDPLSVVVADLAKDLRLICFDEFQVNDIADAMILGRLFTGLLDKGVLVVATSNLAPNELYKNGLQRALFLPFIALIKERLDIIEIGGQVDHRLARLAGQPVYFSPDDETATNLIDNEFTSLIDDETAKPVMVNVDGRNITVPLAASRVARFHFDNLCRKPLAAGDYIALANRFAVIIIDHIPVFKAEERNEAVRFIALVDQLYEHRTKLIASGKTEIARLYPESGPYAFEFKRTISRLTEMQSVDYLLY